MQRKINLIMFVSLIIVFISGLLLKPFPMISIRIIHILSGFLLTGSAIMHMYVHKMFKRSQT